MRQIVIGLVVLLNEALFGNLVRTDVEMAVSIKKEEIQVISVLMCLDVNVNVEISSLFSAIDSVLSIK